MSFYDQFNVPPSQVWACKCDGTHAVLSNDGAADGAWGNGVTAIKFGDGTFTQRAVSAQTDLIDLTGVGITGGVHIIGSGIGQTIIIAPTGQDQNDGGAYWKPGNYSIIQDVEGHLPLNAMVGRSWYLAGDGNFGGTYAQVAFINAAFIRCKWVSTGADIYNIVTQEFPTDGPCSMLVLNNILSSATDNTNSDQVDSSITLVGCSVIASGERGTCMTNGMLSMFGTTIEFTGATGLPAYGSKDDDSAGLATINLYGCTLNVIAGSGGTAYSLYNGVGVMNADEFTLSHLNGGATFGVITTVTAPVVPAIYDLSAIFYGPAGSDAGDGSVARPFLTRARAIQFQSQGDQIVYLPGVGGQASQITEDVTQLLNSAPSGTFSQAFTAVRRYVPLNSRDQLANLTVSVVPKSRGSQFISRDRKENLYEVDVCVQKALANPENLAEIDALTALVDSIEEYCQCDFETATRRILPVTGARLIQSNQKPLYDLAHLKDSQIFTSLITLTYETSGTFR